jgi:TPR repeat protein
MIVKHRRAALFGWIGVLVVLLSMATVNAAELRESVTISKRLLSSQSVRSIIVRAEHGDASAQATLAFMYEFGRGVPQNYVTAAYWNTRAAEQGQPIAQYALGLMYNNAHGVPHDLVLAYMWLNLAAAGASPRNMESWIRIRNAMMTKMTKREIAEGQRLAMLWKPRSEK